MKVDQGFLNNIIELFSTGEESSREQEVSDFTVWSQQCARYFLLIYLYASTCKIDFQKMQDARYFAFWQQKCPQIFFSKGFPPVLLF